MHLPCRVFLIAAAIQLKMTEVTVIILSVIVKLKNKWHFFFCIYSVFWRQALKGLSVNINIQHVLQILPPLSVNSFETEKSPHNSNKE